MMIYVSGELIIQCFLCLLGGTSIATVVNMNTEHNLIKWFSTLLSVAGERLLTCRLCTCNCVLHTASTKFCNLLSVHLPHLGMRVFLLLTLFKPRKTTLILQTFLFLCVMYVHQQTKTITVTNLFPVTEGYLNPNCASLKLFVC